MKSPIHNLSKVRILTFWQEFRERSGFIGVIALTNPAFITFYVMFLHKAHGGLQFWFIGILLTAIVCIIASLFMGLVIYAERRRFRQEVRRELMWHDVMPYDGKPSKAG